jgi:hypothetical protein
MKRFNVILSMVAAALISATPALAQPNNALAENAALRYWSAFSEMQDTGLSDQQAKELTSILDGTAPYDDSQYKQLLEKNAPALDVMARATNLANCDWGLDYGLGQDIPMEYTRKALALGRLNVLYAFHLLQTGDTDHGVRTLIAGLRFSHDVANGGSLFAAVVAKDLLASHLKAVSDAVRGGKLSPAQRAQLQAAIGRLQDGLDWSTSAKRDLNALRADYAGNAQAGAALSRIISAYLAAINDGSRLSDLDREIASAPKDIAAVIPNARRVLEQKQDLNDALSRTQAMLK